MSSLTFFNSYIPVGLIAAFIKDVIVLFSIDWFGAFGFILLKCESCV